jgi:ribosomal protein L37E
MMIVDLIIEFFGFLACSFGLHSDHSVYLNCRGRETIECRRCGRTRYVQYRG